MLYNALLSVYIQNNHKFSPLEVLEQMQQHDLEPNRVRRKCLDCSFYSIDYLFDRQVYLLFD